MHATVAVIFDMDGVLVDSADAHRRAWQQLGQEVGVPFSAELFRQTFGQRNASIIPTWLGANVPGWRADALGERKEVLYRDLVRQGAIRIYDRIPDLFDELHGLGAQVGVASSGPRANVVLLLDTMGATTMIDALISSEDVRQGKPHPEAFLIAAQRLGVAARHCAIIEDSVHGIEAATRAGMLAVAVLTSTPRETLAAAGAALIVEEVARVDPQDLLDRLRAR